MRAMVIDDSKAIRRIIGKILKDLGFEVFEAGHGKEALDKLGEIGVLDLALVDWNMPEMNGYEFLCTIHQVGTATDGGRKFEFSDEKDLFVNLRSAGDELEGMT